MIRTVQDDQFEVVFTMAVLEHLHPESNWVFGEIARITSSILITIEDERSVYWRVFPRNYRRIFERRGMVQIEEHSCADVPGLGPAFVARVLLPL